MPAPSALLADVASSTVGLRLGRGSAAAQEPAQSLELLDRGAAREAAIAPGRRNRPQARSLRRERGLGGGQGFPSLQQGEGVEEGEPDETLVVVTGQGGRLSEPAPQLAAAGGGHPVEVPTGPAPGPQDPQEDPPIAAQLPQRGVYLGEARAPRRIDLGVQRAREVVAGARRFLKEAEKDVWKRHAQTIST